MNAPRLAYKPKIICMWFCIMVVLAMSLKAGSAKAEEPLTLAETIQLATQNQPLLQSLDDAAASSRQAAIAEGQLPDPKVKFGVINLPVTTSDALRYNRDDQTMVNVGISQDVIPLKKRELASNRMLAEADQFQTEQVATARTIERDVALAWLDAYEAQRKSELYQRLIDDMTAERKLLAANVSSGGAKTSDVLRMDTDISMTNEKRIFAQRDERKARAALARWIGKSASRSIASELPVMTNSLSHGANQAALEQHPLLRNAYQTEKVAQFDVDSAQANLERNWGWEVGYGKRFNDRSDMLSFQVSIDLQLDRANRQDRRTAEKLVLVEKARKLTEDRRRELSSELESAMADAEAADARETERITKLIPNAHAKLSIAQAAYQSGRQSIGEVWQARRDVIDIELDHWTILTDKQRAAIKIGYLINDSRLFKQIEKE
ncbi:MAG: TolC family protein [Methylotenera sp.]|jgi:cobalt-zinc-cadmium efflux system outer membrane protein|nr:TolC family protein [Methylotenera sp.]